RPPANTLPGGMAHTAGGRKDEPEITYWSVVRQLGPEYYLTYHKRPCVRDSLLVGIPTGAVIGGLAGVLRRPVWTACTYAWFSWIGASVLSYEYCQYWRSKEKEGIRQMRELMEKKKVKVEARREERRRLKEERDRLEEERKEAERRKSWSYWVDKNVRFW
ncbi:hypothetical protein EJ04DRAFT_409012, partial [Polyplosphaeria fusca]